ncbi:MAG TPA: hypothetical protein VFY16_02980, partial [Gemmatimonadaceae bacterium]|nr:hypothetical protein [Gemmatimonadaceae bacterium]
MSEEFTRNGGSLPTETYPVVARGGIRITRQATRVMLRTLRNLGRRGYYARALFRALGAPDMWGRETVRQMYGMGVGSIPLVIIVAAFLGGVTAFQTF